MLYNFNSFFHFKTFKEKSENIHLYTSEKKWTNLRYTWSKKLSSAYNFLQVFQNRIYNVLKVRKRRAPTALTLRCNVCSAPAPDHLHFGGHCCYSCRAFFRRTIERMRKIDVVCKAGDNECLITESSKSCSACRFEKCLRIGMKRELLQVIFY